MRFKDKVAVVTGGNSGIGKETAKRLVAEGASVVLGGRDEAKLRSAAEEIGGGTDRDRILTGDLPKPANRAALAENPGRNFGALDSLTNKAGVFKPKTFAEITEEDYEWF